MRTRSRRQSGPRMPLLGCAYVKYHYHMYVCLCTQTGELEMTCLWSHLFDGWRHNKKHTWNSKIYTHTRARARAHARLTALCPGLPRWVGTRKAKPIWILLKQEIVSGSGISWAVCNSAPRSRQITTPTPHYSVFYRPDALPAAQPTASEHWRL